MKGWGAQCLTLLLHSPTPSLIGGCWQLTAASILSTALGNGSHPHNGPPSLGEISDYCMRFRKPSLLLPSGSFTPMRVSISAPKWVELLGNKSLSASASCLPFSILLAGHPASGVISCLSFPGIKDFPKRQDFSTKCRRISGQPGTPGICECKLIWK